LVFMQCIFKDFPSDVLAEWAAVVWSIWNALNKRVYEDCQILPAIILSNGVTSNRQSYPWDLRLNHGFSNLCSCVGSLVVMFLYIIACVFDTHVLSQ
jgi:hypothetical protein